MKTGRVITFVLVGVLALAGCGSKKQDSGGGGAQAVPGVTLPPQDSDLNVKPVIPKPVGQPPASLQVRDVVQGKGQPPQAGWPAPGRRSRFATWGGARASPPSPATR